MSLINRNSKGIAVVIDVDGRFLYTITDGDLRRALLSGLDIDTSIDQWALKHPEQGNRGAITMPFGTAPAELLLTMQAGSLRQIPILDEEGRVVEVAFLNDFIAEDRPLRSAVVMAGGQGMRLRPLTTDVPKPMLPVGDRPLMEHIVQQLRQAGIRQVSVSTHYKAESIVNHFGNGEKFGVEIAYVKEEQPLGTAGALSLLPTWTSTLLVVNGDILTDLNYRTMCDFHREHDATLTVGVRQFDIEVPYGVIDTDGVDVRQLSEKPTLRFLVNAGVYLLEPVVQSYMERGKRTDMTDMIVRLLAAKLRIISFPISEYWLDVGQHVDYQKAQADFGSGGAP
jgi:dTDP-glucose pyrophosphorylase